jgi:general secretion pathway protein G
MVGRTRARDEQGFTLIEMIIVVTIMGILAAIAVPQFRTSLTISREAVLKEDLYRFRQAIDQYHADKGYYPASLETLVEEGYLRRIEPDPFTKGTDWVIVNSEPEPDAPSDQSVGVYDVHSAATGDSLGGGPYSEW